MFFLLVAPEKKKKATKLKFHTLIKELHDIISNEFGHWL